MPEIDTQVPVWLQRNWVPRETFDPTPWLQERYRRQQEAQIMPLKLQALALQNKASALAIEHQGIVNDEASQEMDFFQEDLPALRAAGERANRVPGGSLNMPAPELRSRKAQEQWLRRQASDAQLVYNKAYAQEQIELTKLAGELTAKEIDVEGARLEGPNGTPRWDRAKLSEAASLAGENAFIRAMELRKAGRFGAGAEYAPIVQELNYGGKKIPILVNPHTGRYEVLKSAPNAAAKAEISMNAARVKELYKAHDNISESDSKGLFGGKQSNNEKRAEILARIETLKQRNRELAGETAGFGGDETAPAPATGGEQLFEYKPGKGIVPVAPAP